MSAGKKNDSEKLRMELLSVPALRAISEVLTFGAKKYEAHNWRGGFNWTRLHGAALRHLTAHLSGEDRDPESGLSHLAHLSCCVMFLLEHEICGLGLDDRYVTAEKVPEKTVTELYKEISQVAKAQREDQVAWEQVVGGFGGVK